MNNRRKLIEVALPLEAINKESARETHPIGRAGTVRWYPGPEPEEIARNARQSVH
ncbi:MAG: hypothetical protein ACREEM_06030 [Blastocatellia bacterium]